MGMGGAHFRPKLVATTLFALLGLSGQFGTTDRHPHIHRWRRETCGTSQFRCGSGECIAKSLICDGEKNCKDRSDETSETCINVIAPALASYLHPPLISFATKCPSSTFQCKTGVCISEKAKCNGRADCSDGSDEAECTSTGTPGSSSTGTPGTPETPETPSIGTPGTPGTPVISPDLFNGACDLPKPPDNGEYQINCPSPPCAQGQMVQKFTTLTFSCKKGYTLSGPEFLWCDKKWSSRFPSCTSVKCPPLVNPTRDIKCSLEEKEMNCYEPMLPGTRARVKCLSYTFTTDSIDLSDYETVCTENGQWSKSVDSCKTKLCPPLLFFSRDIECKLNSEKVDCRNGAPPGTRAVVRCNAEYTHDPEFLEFDTECQQNGQWRRQVTSCLPKCGIPNEKGLPFVANGIPAKRSEFPWHVGIYTKKPDGSMEQICGGSIVSPHSIVTAAHCFWNEGKAEPVGLADYRVIAGKHFLDWNTRTQPDYAQELSIGKVELHDRFKGVVRSYAHDIAVAIVNEEIQMTKAVRPICMDYQQMFTNFFTPGITGVVIGWGITERNIQSETLQTARLPLVDFSVCEKEVPESFLPFLTFDKFCAGYRNGTSVCRGDSGGGFAAKFRDGRWYLMGIVSVGVPDETATDACNIFQYTTFTKIVPYYEFIRRYVV